VVRGITEACRESDCELLGGETAEMPGFYKPGEYDLAGFAVGVVDRDKQLRPKDLLKAGDLLLGLPSSGLHSNGYSLVRRLFTPEDWRERADVLLAPTELYVRSVLAALAKLNKGTSAKSAGKNWKIKGLVHITGGGFIDNIPRILPKSLSAVIELGSWDIPPIFSEIQKRGSLPDSEMLRTFNMGIGMIMAVSPDAAAAAEKFLPNALRIGRIEKGNQDVRFE